MFRRVCKKICVGGVNMGGDAKISVQSMLSRPLSFREEALSDVDRLKKVGCDVIRVALSNMDELSDFRAFCLSSKLPVVADIQRNHLLAIAAIENGAAKIRINPCYIGTRENVESVVAAAILHKTPIRVGVNMGSLEENAEKKYGRTAEGLAESCLYSVRMLENMGFYDIVASVKSSSVEITTSANKILAAGCDYPIHIGVTEAGTKASGEVKNAIGIGSLLLQGIGDTIRVSLSSDIVDEVVYAKRILKSLGLVPHVEVVSCPTCSRCRYDLFSLSKKIEELTENLEVPLKVAVMGCVVNGVGEGRDADVGIAGGGDGKFILFRNGEIVRQIEGDPIEQFMNMIFSEIEKKSK